MQPGPARSLETNTTRPLIVSVLMSGGFLGLFPLGDARQPSLRDQVVGCVPATLFAAVLPVTAVLAAAFQPASPVWSDNQ